jgi:hypothetical protein
MIAAWEKCQLGFDGGREHASGDGAEDSWRRDVRDRKETSVKKREHGEWSEACGLGQGGGGVDDRGTM